MATFTFNKDISTKQVKATITRLSNNRRTAKILAHSTLNSMLERYEVHGNYDLLQPVCEAIGKAVGGKKAVAAAIEFCVKYSSLDFDEEVGFVHVKGTKRTYDKAGRIWEIEKQESKDKDVSKAALDNSMFSLIAKEDTDFDLAKKALALYKAALKANKEGKCALEYLAVCEMFALDTGNSKKDMPTCPTIEVAKAA